MILKVNQTQHENLWWRCFSWFCWGEQCLQNTGSSFNLERHKSAANCRLCGCLGCSPRIPAKPLWLSNAPDHAPVIHFHAQTLERQRERPQPHSADGQHTMSGQNARVTSLTTQTTSQWQSREPATLPSNPSSMHCFVTQIYIKQQSKC